MHHSLKKIKKERFADLIQNIIKKQTKEEIFQSVTSEMKIIKSKKFKNPDLILALNDQVSEFDFMPVLGGEHKGEISIKVVLVEGKYKGLKYYIEKKLFKKSTKIDTKTMDSMFFLHTYHYAIMAHDDRRLRKVLDIKKGLFG